MALTIEILAIGAAAGIAWVDAGGALRVGPQSAGANPGPACYGLGGTKPTVSDACVVLNRLNPDYFLAGEMTLDRAAAERAVREHIAEPLAMEVADAAEGILRVVTANMNRVIRSILIARGFDIRTFTLMAFGGAGGMVAGELLRIGDVSRLVVPSNPDAVSAIGMLATDLRHDFAQSSVQSLAGVAWGEVEHALRWLQERGAERLRSDGVADDAMHFNDALDLRYVGQDYYLRVYVDSDDLDGTRIRADFDRLRERTYGFANPEFEVEKVNARVFAIGAFERPQLPKIGVRAASDGPLQTKARRQVYFGGAFAETDIYNVTALRADDAIAGPCVVEDPRSTIVVMPGQSATVDRFRNLTIEAAA